MWICYNSIYPKESLLAFDTCKFYAKDESDDAELNKKSERQLVQRLQALVILIDAADNKQGLSEELIKEAHEYLMKGLVTWHDSKKHQVEAGKYRDQDVWTFDHQYPDSTIIADELEEIVTKYEERFFSTT